VKTRNFWVSVLQDNAEPLDSCGEKTKYLISYFLSNTFVKNCRNRIMYVKIRL